MKSWIPTIVIVGCVRATCVFGQATVTALPENFLLESISDDGRVAVGFVPISAGARWTADGGLTIVDQLDKYSGLVDVSADGLVAVGFAGRTPGTLTYWLGSDHTGTLLPTEPSNAVVQRISANGHAIAGSFYKPSPDGSYIEYPVRWEFVDAIPLIVSTGLLSGTHIAALSGDGSAMTGTITTGMLPEAFVWTAAAGAISLGQLEPGDGSTGSGVSRDGTVVFGASGGRTFRWTSGTGMQALSSEGVPYNRLGVNNDGSLAVGFGSYVWREGMGFIPANQWLSGLGANMDDWNNVQLTDLSGDGTVVAGNGVDPEGISRSFIITGLGAVPEPSTYGVAAIAALALGAAVRRYRRRSKNLGI